ncbi:MAG TPA: hypothetical protein VJ673_11555 [Aromatoleum sp.]|uniref:hypothetical protein n=1 Tax=Aromatoleum sp. TaxID=2307007 RepID=UPI002B49FF87|nr:hypothetical protein [Aromatoleum sp.]HJV26318.1 hypothetical protein [Aromatoleum sp.]
MTTSHDFLDALIQRYKEDSAQTLDELVEIQKMVTDLRAGRGLPVYKEEVKEALQSAFATIQAAHAILQSNFASLEHKRALFEELGRIVDEAEEPAHLAGQQP